MSEAFVSCNLNKQDEQNTDPWFSSPLGMNVFISLVFPSMMYSSFEPFASTEELELSSLGGIGKSSC